MRAKVHTLMSSKCGQGAHHGCLQPAVGLLASRVGDGKIARSRTTHAMTLSGTGIDSGSAMIALSVVNEVQTVCVVLMFPSIFDQPEPRRELRRGASFLFERRTDWYHMPFAMTSWRPHRQCTCDWFNLARHLVNLTLQPRQRRGAQDLIVSK
jgi:hypothetical protein